MGKVSMHQPGDRAEPGNLLVASRQCRHNELDDDSSGDDSAGRPELGPASTVFGSLASCAPSSASRVRMQL